MAAKKTQAGVDPLVAELYQRGYSVDEIALDCGLSMEQIRIQCDMMLSRWEESMDCDPMRAELRSVYFLERLYRRMAHSVLYPSARDEPEESGGVAQRRMRTAGRGGESTDIKPLQGIERCVELRMRLISGATPRALVEESGELERNQMVVDLTRLSRGVLLELLAACPHDD